MSTLGHWVAADAGGAGVTLPDRGPLNMDGTLSGGCTWVTVGGEAAVNCPSSDNVEVSSSFPYFFQSTQDYTVFFRGRFHALGAGTKPAFIGRDGQFGLAVPVAIGYTVNLQDFVLYERHAQPKIDQVLSVDTIYAFVVRRSRQSALVTLSIYDAAGVLIQSVSVDDSSNVVEVPPTVLTLGWGAFGTYNGDIDGIAWRIESEAVTDAEAAAIASDPELDGTVAPLPPDPTPGADGLIGHFVSEDAGNTGPIIPDRALGNDAYVQPISTLPGNSLWQTMDDGCDAWFTTPTTGISGGAVARQISAYDVTDFTLLVCSEMAGGHPFPWSMYGVAERFPPICDGSIPNGGPWWVFGLRNDGLGGVDPTIRFRHTDGVTIDQLESDPLPVPFFVEVATTAPGGGTTMSSLYCIGVKRSGNDFTFFWKGAVFKRSTGLPIDPTTGDPAMIPDAVVVGSGTSSLVSGVVDAPLRLLGGFDINSFGSKQDGSWAAMWNVALADEDILSIIDTAYPVCAVQLYPLQIDAELIASDETVYNPRIGTSAELAICSTFVEHVCLILTADWEFGRQVVPIYRNDLIFVNARQQPLTFVNGNDEVLSFNATGLMLSKSDVAGVYGHYLGWSARGEAAPFRIETVEMEYQSTREWDTSP